MTAMLGQALETARDTLLNKPMYENEMCREVIVSVFRELDWNIHDKRHEFRGQYPIRLFKNKPPLKADYALFAEDDAQNPLLLIEAKRPGEMKDADDQVNTYLSLVHSAKAGIATDGRDWRIYLRERRLALEFSLETVDIKYLAELLPTVLGRDAVARGDAVGELEECYKQTQAKHYFDDAWSQLSDDLLDLFIEKVKDRAGTEPSRHDARAFVKGKLAGESNTDAVRRPNRPSGRRYGSKRSIKVTLFFDGKEESEPCHGVPNTIRKLLKWAVDTDPDFMSKLKAKRVAQGKKVNVHKTRPPHDKYRFSQIGGFWIRTGAGQKEIDRLIKDCGEITGRNIEARVEPTHTTETEQ